MTQYTAIAVFHHPGGVLLPGETHNFSSGEAERGIAAGSLVLAQPKPAKPAKSVDKPAPITDPQE